MGGVWAARSEARTVSPLDQCVDVEVLAVEDVDSRARQTDAILERRIISRRGRHAVAPHERHGLRTVRHQQEPRDEVRLPEDHQVRRNRREDPTAPVHIVERVDRRQEQSTRLVDADVGHGQLDNRRHGAVTFAALDEIAAGIGWRHRDVLVMQERRVVRLGAVLHHDLPVEWNLVVHIRCRRYEVLEVEVREQRVDLRQTRRERQRILVEAREHETVP